MAQGTAGLGQDQAVFDFSNIGKQGLMLDEVKYQRKARFAKDNASIYEDIDDSFIRDVDRPYLSARIEEYMELSAKAISSQDSDLAQQASNMKSELSRLTATSKAARTQGTAAFSELQQSDEYARSGAPYNTHYQEHTKATAMTANNKGQVGEAILYTPPNFYTLDESVDDFATKHANSIIKASMESRSSSVSNADGTGSSRSTQIQNEEARTKIIGDTYQTMMANDASFNAAIDAQLVSDYFGTKDITNKQVGQWNAIKDYGESLRDPKGEYGFQSIEEIAQHGAFKNNPNKLAQAQKAFNIENESYEKGLKMYGDAVRAKSTVASSISTKKDNSKTRTSDGGGVSSGDMALNTSKTIKGLLGDVKMTVGGVPEALNNRIQAKGSTLGYASVPNMKLQASGSGTQKVVISGFVSSRNEAGEFVRYAVQYKPSPDVIEKMERGENISDYLQKMDASLVPLDQARSRVLRKYVQPMMDAADKQALGTAEESLL